MSASQFHAEADVDISMRRLCRALDKLHDVRTSPCRFSYAKSCDGASVVESRAEESRSQQQLQPPLNLWKVPELPKLTYNLVLNSHYNALDDDTIYDIRRDEQDAVVLHTEQTPMLPPLETSLRFQQARPDQQQVAEKRMVLKHMLGTGNRRHFECDRAVVPSVYADFFDCPRRTKSYIRAMYTDEFVPTERTAGANSLRCTRAKYASRDSCQYCDVIGNKYCSFCIEFKNRHFAWGYENNLIAVQPTTPRRRPAREQLVDPRYMTSLVGKSTVLNMQRTTRRLPPLQPSKQQQAAE